MFFVVPFSSSNQVVGLSLKTLMIATWSMVESLSAQE